MRGMQGIAAAAGRSAAATWRSVRRAVREPGRERDVLAQAVKGAFAACVAWAVAGWWLNAPMAFMAPWMAIVLVESTVYRSVRHGLQQLAAIAVGTAVATGCGMALGSSMAAMVLVLPAVMLLGQWKRLGSQGIFAGTAALFVLTTGPVTVAASASRLAEAGFGALVGIAVNALIRPPVYLRDTRAALQDAAQGAQELLREIARRLPQGQPDADTAADWHDAALRVQRLVDQARSAADWHRESLSANPLRRGGAVPQAGEDYDDAVTALDYIALHITDVTRTMLEASTSARRPTWLSPDTAALYARFVDSTARAVRLYARDRLTPGAAGREADGERGAAAQELAARLRELRQQLAGAPPYDPDALATFGSLLSQAHRLTDRLTRS